MQCDAPLHLSDFKQDWYCATEMWFATAPGIIAAVILCAALVWKIYRHRDGLFLPYLAGASLIAFVGIFSFALVEYSKAKPKTAAVASLPLLKQTDIDFD